MRRAYSKIDMARITVVGSYVVALVMDVDRPPVVGETMIGRNFRTTHGGKGSNIAVAAARLGAEAAFVGRVGRDAFGEACHSLFAREGVKRDGLIVSDNRPTASGFILGLPGGANMIVVDSGANGLLSAVDVTEHAALVSSADVVLSPLEIPLEAALAGARTAKATGHKAIINPAPARDLRGIDLSDVWALTPNEMEACVCLGLAPNDPTPQDRLARRLRVELGVPHVFLTRGARGAVWASADGIVQAPALQVNTVDTVGAGDAFNAALALALGEGRSCEEALAFAVTAASLSTEKRETIDSYPSRADVEARVGEVQSCLHEGLRS